MRSTWLDRANGGGNLFSRALVALATASRDHAPPSLGQAPSPASARAQPTGRRETVRARASACACARACVRLHSRGRAWTGGQERFFWREAAFVHAHVRAMRSQLRAELPAPTHLLPGECLADFPASVPSLNESIVTVGGSEMDANGHTGD